MSQRVQEVFREFDVRTWERRASFRTVDGCDQCLDARCQRPELYAVALRTNQNEDWRAYDEAVDDCDRRRR